MAYQPKSYKKFVATAATATLVASAVAPVASASFTDVNSNYKDAVNYLVQTGIADGMSETTFGVASVIKRGDAAVMIASALGLDTTTAPDAGFKDLNTRVAGAVNAIVKAGIANGKTETTFAPDAAISRQEMAKMLANAYGLTATTNASFEDVNSNWLPYVSALVEAGVTFGYNDTTFGSTDSVTRGQFALFVYRAEGSPAPAPAVASLDFNTEGNEFTLMFGTALPENADLEYVLENYDIEVNGSAITTAQIDALNLSIKSVSADMKTVVVSHTDLDDLATTFGGTSVMLQVGGKSATHTFDVEAKVSSVMAINAKTIEIKFNKAIKADSVIGTVGTDDTLENGVVKIDSVDGSPAVTADLAGASLSEDGKTLTVTATGAEFFNGKYAVTLSSAIVATNDEALVAYSGVMTNVDAARPTVTSVTYSDYQTAKIWFSEPLKTDGTVTFNNGSGALQGAFTAGDNFVTVDLTSSTANENVTVTMIGAKDYNDNLISPNPVTVTVVKSTADTVKPVVTATEVLSLDKFKVTFSEKLLSAPVITVDGDTVVSGAPVGAQVQGTITADASGLVYTVDLAVDKSTGLHTIAVPTFKDKSNNSGDAFSKVVNFAADTTAPTVSSATKQVISGKEYLVVEFAEDVTAMDDKDITGTFVADFVTNNVTIVTDTNSAGTAAGVEVDATVTAVTGNTKAVKVDLTAVSAGSYNVTLPTGFVKDASGNDSTAKAVSFTRTSDTDLTKPALVSAYGTNGILVDSNKVVTVKFDKKLDALTALDKNNYSIEGVTISTVELIKNDSAEAIVRLTLADSSVAVSGLRNVSVMNVKSSNGVAMNTVNTTENFTENVKPTASAKLTNSNVITLTFNENVYNPGAGLDVDFDLYVGATKVTAATLDTEDVAIGGAKNTLTLTLSGYTLTAQDLASGLSVKAVDATDIKDANGNGYTAGTVLTVQQ